MTVSTGVIEADDITQAWLQVIDHVRQGEQHKMTHVIVRVADATREQPAIRQLADGLLSELGHQPIETVANTLFPQAWAASRPEPRDLAEYYRQMLPTLQRATKNNKGLYFGRLVAYPLAGGERADQLTMTVDKLRQELGGKGGPKSSRYELNVTAPGLDAPVYSPSQDAKKTMDFPCLSFVSFHLDGGLHLSAQYRNQMLIERGYGNYLGLGRLQRYVADAVGVKAGELLVVAGHAQVDAGVRRLQRLLSEAEGLVES